MEHPRDVFVLDESKRVDRPEDVEVTLTEDEEALDRSLVMPGEKDSGVQRLSIVDAKDGVAFSLRSDAK